MPIIQSAIKRVRQTKRKTLRNVTTKRLTKEVIKKFLNHVAAGEMNEAKALFPTVQKRIDFMNKKNIWHANKASRKVSAYAKMIADKK